MQTALTEVEREHNGEKRMPTFAATKPVAGSRRSDYLRTGGYRVLPDGSIETQSLINASRIGE